MNHLTLRDAQGDSFLSLGSKDRITLKGRLRILLAASSRLQVNQKRCDKNQNTREAGSAPRVPVTQTVIFLRSLIARFETVPVILKMGWLVLCEIDLGGLGQKD
jgi:hypothetical protein